MLQNFVLPPMDLDDMMMTRPPMTRRLDEMPEDMLVKIMMFVCGDDPKNAASLAITCHALKKVFMMPFRNAAADQCVEMTTFPLERLTGAFDAALIKENFFKQTLEFVGTINGRQYASGQARIWIHGNSGTNDVSFDFDDIYALVPENLQRVCTIGDRPCAPGLAQMRSSTSTGAPPSTGSIHVRYQRIGMRPEWVYTGFRQAELGMLNEIKVQERARKAAERVAKRAASATKVAAPARTPKRQRDAGGSIGSGQKTMDGFYLPSNVAAPALLPQLAVALVD